MIRMFEREKESTAPTQEEKHLKNPQEEMHQKREEFDQEHDLSHLSSEEKKRMHEEYSKIGSMGGNKRAEDLKKEGYQDMGHMGGVTRAEQMAKSGQTQKK